MTELDIFSISKHVHVIWHKGRAWACMSLSKICILLFSHSSSPPSHTVVVHSFHTIYFPWPVKRSKQSSLRLISAATYIGVIVSRVPATGTPLPSLRVIVHVWVTKSIAVRDGEWWRMDFWNRESSLTWQTYISILIGVGNIFDDDGDDDNDEDLDRDPKITHPLPYPP